MTTTPAKLCAALIAGLALATPAYPWAREGHMAVAAIAREGLTADARAHVVKILGNDDLPAISVWMDELRTAVMHAGALAFDPDAIQFNHEFPKNGEWHYVDMPLGTVAYDPDSPFAKPDDVVHSIAQAVDVLEGKGDPRISRKEALYMLVHFVGDLHQPLHVGNGYYTFDAADAATLVTDPEAARGLPNDKGGNLLFFGTGRFEELHAYWDSALVTKITHSDVTAQLVKALEPRVAAEGAGWKSTGDYHHWAEAWATESLAAARTAYAGVVLGAVKRDAKGDLQRITVTLPSQYDATCVPIAETRLAQAGYHLAEILNAIHWAD